MAGERTVKVLAWYRNEYRRTSRLAKGGFLDRFCRLTRYHRKYAISLLGGPQQKEGPRRRRGVSYSPQALGLVRRIWRSAGYPCGSRLKSLLPQWLPAAEKRFPWLTEELKQEVLAISARQIDRRLAKDRRVHKQRLYGRTKPGKLLKHVIAIKTDHWDVKEPGFTEIDLVSHSGSNASGQFIHSLNVTEILSGWVESRAVMGRGEVNVLEALKNIRAALPFALKGIDSDNGSEFINYHLFKYCTKNRIQFTRGRPYKKNDNAHVEQKNWTHVRKIFGWQRYDTYELLQAMNELYQHDLSCMMNLFQPSAKLIRKRRVGSRVQRKHDAPQTPLDRLIQHYQKSKTSLPRKILMLQKLRNSIDPFVLAESIDKKLSRIQQHLPAPKPQQIQPTEEHYAMQAR